MGTQQIPFPTYKEQKSKLQGNTRQKHDKTSVRAEAQRVVNSTSSRIRDHGIGCNRLGAKVVLHSFRSHVSRYKTNSHSIQRPKGFAITPWSLECRSLSLKASGFKRINPSVDVVTVIRSKLEEIGAQPSGSLAGDPNKPAKLHAFLRLLNSGGLPTSSWRMVMGFRGECGCFTQDSVGTPDHCLSSCSNASQIRRHFSPTWTKLGHYPLLSWKEILIGIPKDTQSLHVYTLDPRRIGLASDVLRVAPSTGALGVVGHSLAMKPIHKQLSTRPCGTQSTLAWPDVTTCWV